MTWDTSNRRSRLPSNWQELRASVLKRDNYRCRIISNNERCTSRATEVDHIIAGDDHGMYNLQSICTQHHKQKTQIEAIAARATALAARKVPQERHPGYKK